MGKFFKGLASCGAWACFDEFNRIDVEVLSVVAQQIMTLQNGVNLGQTKIMFEESDINLNPQFAVFVTMNPGYAGRTELPDNLKALFRPVAMMVPDYALIAEIMLFSFGFEHGLLCASKMIATFRLCSEQLSTQDHYDYGMRAVKTVITAAGNLKQQFPDVDEEVLILRALQDVNLPKFLGHDVPLFKGILSDLFPTVTRPDIDYGALTAALQAAAVADGLQAVPEFVTKCLQLYETIVVRHGLMMVGPTGGGKSCVMRVLAAALSALAADGVRGPRYQPIHRFVLNPKAVTMGQLYGESDPNTNEWRDGILAAIVRKCARAEDGAMRWVVFDGPVDALWIENMNTVLDDNKKLCLVSGEIIALSDDMEVMFEVEDLAVASPATVSRCGMVYTEPSVLGLLPPFHSWLQRLPPAFPGDVAADLQALFDTFVPPALDLLRRHLAEPVPTVDNNLVKSLSALLDCFFEPFRPQEGREPSKPSDVATLRQHLPALFVFSLAWSVGASTDGDGRVRFDAWLRDAVKAAALPALLPPPAAGLVYDLAFNQDAGSWEPWLARAPPFAVSPKLAFSEIIVPTKDSVRYQFLARSLVTNRKNVLVTGDTGTGKTVNVTQMLLHGMPEQYTPLTLTFSARTSANQTQDIIDGKLEKRQRGTYGPVAGCVYVMFVDDLNMPQREKYFAQPPIELLRQWCDHGGWYDRKEGWFRRIVDTVLVSAMGPPGGGRNPITARMVRHFNVLNFTAMDRDTEVHIFRTVLGARLGSPDFDASIPPLLDDLVGASVDVYHTVCAQLLPTPTRPHYTFNMRDLGKVFQGLDMANPRATEDAVVMVRMWVHECRRVFSDRLVNTAGRVWFDEQLQQQVSTRFKMPWHAVSTPNGAGADAAAAGAGAGAGAGAASDPDTSATLHTGSRLIFGDFMVPGADPKVYEEVRDMEALVATMEEYLMDFNAESKTPMKLVLFLDAIEHVSRVSRIIRQPQGHALLLGVGGSGRQSLTRLAAFMADYELFQVEVSKSYNVTEWREDLKQCLMEAGLGDKPMVLLFNDTQTVFEGMFEDLNNILNSGDVPNIYAAEDMDAIHSTCRRDCITKRVAPTKINMYAEYIARVRRNVHVVLCMSPVGDAFRNRLRMFPALVNCTSIDWFSEWPDEALHSVALSSLQEASLGLADAHLAAVVEFFKRTHTSVSRASREYQRVLRRHNYVTPTSYLELLTTFKTVLTSKRTEVDGLRVRLTNGLDRLTSTADQVSSLQEELRQVEPQLLATQKNVDDMIVRIDADKASAAETKVVVEKEEAEAQKMASATQAIAEDAQRDLSEALPALDLAVQCLSKLRKADIDEVRSMPNPPMGVKLTLQATCIMFGIKPVLKDDPSSDVFGRKVKDWWAAAQRHLLLDASKLLSDLKMYDKNNIKARVISDIEPFIAMPEFEPAVIERASKACSGICMWVRAMHKYYYVAKMVEPKKKKLAEAQERLDRTMADLNVAKRKLRDVLDRIADLEDQFTQTQARKEQLASEVERCRTRLDRARKLLGGLGGEKQRWMESVSQLNVDFTNLVGDALVSSATVSYLGAFTPDFRGRLVAECQQALEQLHIPHTPGCSVQTTLADPVKVRQWTVAGLPTDSHSVENGIIMATARRWPLLIDPQGQANRYIKAMGRDSGMAPNGMDVIRQSEKKFLQTLENGIRFGKWVLLEHVSETLDAALEPVLQQQRFRQGGAEMLKLGDSVIPYNDAFRFFITTKLPNPHYPPEMCVKVSLLNFTITPKGLQDQMLGVFVVTELPEMEERKNGLTLANARMKKELQDIESRILMLLSTSSSSNILDDEDLIDTLSQAKLTSEEITAKVKEAEETEHQIDETRDLYRPVAFRASTLYACITDMGVVDPMYQFSLPWFTSLFVSCIRTSPPSEDIDTRIKSLNSHFTKSVYRNVCRSLFARDKLLFSFLMCIKIMQTEDTVDALEWRFLISGQVVGAPKPVAAGSGGGGGADGDDETAAGAPSALPNPSPDWIDDRTWSELQTVSRLPAFVGLAADVCANPAGFKEVFDAADAHTHPLPAPWGGDRLSPLQRMCVLRCLRPDKVMLAVQEFVKRRLGPSFIEPPPFDLNACFEASDVSTPLIFVLSTGSDPTKAFFTFAEQVGMRSKVEGISLGQGQGEVAARLIEDAKAKGQWVLLQNCHLASSWMNELERLVDAIEPDKVAKDFRLWLTSMPSPSFPVSVLQNGVKMTNEPPKGLKQNVRNFYYHLNDDALSMTSKPQEFRRLLFGLSFFHAVVQERKQYGALGWSKAYEFNESDLEISRRQLELFLDEYEEVPYTVLNFLTSYINYGGRVTDDKDLRTIHVILKDVFKPAIQQDDFPFSESGVYRSVAVDDDAPHQGYMAYIESLPLNADPEVFGMHSNADITSAQNETYAMFHTLLSLQPRTGGAAAAVAAVTTPPSGEGGDSSGGGGGGAAVSTTEQLIGETAASILARLPAPFDVEAVSAAYPIKYEESMNTVLVQECLRYNRLLTVMRSSLADMQRALQGLVVMSGELDAMGESLARQRVPAMWEFVAYPSLKPLAAWVDELLARLKFVSEWVQHGAPASFWISGFFFPQAFLTGTLQNFARRYKLPIDSLSFSFTVLDDVGGRPDDGCHVHGLFLEGARWSPDHHALQPSKPKQLYSSLPTLHLLPVEHREPPTSNVYLCPVYKTLNRHVGGWDVGCALCVFVGVDVVCVCVCVCVCVTFVQGTLATTGHSTNFVLYIELPTVDEPPFRNNTGQADCARWIKAGVAAFCALRY